jgi:putative acetyltransferase
VIPAQFVRKETPADIAAIHAVNVAAFPTPAEAELVNRLRANGRLAVSLVADVDDKVVGHIAFSPVTIDGSAAGPGAGLGPVAVLQSHQHSGIGGALIREGIHECRRAGFVYVVVLGDPNYYRVFGFHPAANKGLGNEYGAHDEFRVLELKPWSLEGCQGIVRYGPEFAELT